MNSDNINTLDIFGRGLEGTSLPHDTGWTPFPISHLKNQSMFHCSKRTHSMFGLLFGLWILGFGMPTIAEAADPDSTFVVIPDAQGMSTYYPTIW